LPTRLREAGMPIEDVTRLAALVTLPWAFKFLWAPLVDVLRPRRLGLRGWILAAQLAMGLALLPVAWIEIPHDAHLLLAVLMTHAVCAATQDVSIDALAVASVPAGERGALSGWMQVGMLAGRAAFGGLALVLERSLGAAAVIHLLVATVWATGLVALWAAPEPAGPPVAAGTAARRFARTIGAVGARPATWLGLGCALLAGAAMEATGAVTGPLLVDRGFLAWSVGGFFAGPAALAMGAGALLGGRLSDRGPRAAVVARAVLVLFATVGWVAAAASPDVGSGWLLASLAAAFVGFGVLTASLYALLMEHTDPAIGGTQFSTYMGAVNAGTVWSTWLVGYLAARWDYPFALVATSATSLLVLPLLARLRRTASPASAGA
jgi:MFS family permease